MSDRVSMSVYFYEWAVEIARMSVCSRVGTSDPIATSATTALDLE